MRGDGREVRGPLKRRTLRLGSHGNEVVRLQARLQDLGYDPGPLDGAYGYLTYAAVRDFQRDYRLPADGTVGRRVRAVLYDDRLTARREWLVVAEPRMDAGRMIALRTLARQADVLSAVSLSVGIQPGTDETEVPADIAAAAGNDASDVGEVVGTHIPSWVSLHNRRGTVLGDYEPGALQMMLHSRRGRKRLNDLIDASLTESATEVVHLQLGHLRWGDGARFLGIVKRAARRVHAHGKQLVVSMPLRDLDDAWTRLATDIDYAAVGALASRIVLVPPVRTGRREPPRPLSPVELAAAVRAVVRRIPPWRCLLAISLGALVLGTQRDSGPPAAMSYQRAMAMAYGARTRPQWDDASGQSKFHGRLDEQDVSVWLETKASFSHKLDIARRARLAGVYLSSVGDEDVRLWRVLRERLPKYESPAS